MKTRAAWCTGWRVKDDTAFVSSLMKLRAGCGQIVAKQSRQEIQTQSRVRRGCAAFGVRYLVTAFITPRLVAARSKAAIASLAATSRRYQSADKSAHSK
jgi:hypothetical protein